jgi:hypothetical protein
MSGPPSLPKKLPSVFVRTTADKARRFALDLEAAIQSAMSTGGGYSAFIMLKDGRKLHVEVNP